MPLSPQSHVIVMGGGAGTRRSYERPRRDVCAER